MASTDPKNNLLIDMLPQSAFRRIEQQLETVSLRAGEVLIEPEAAFDVVYFPVDSIVSLDNFVSDKRGSGEATASVALTGREGLVGIELVLSAQTAISRVTVRVDGSALRMHGDALRAEFVRGTAMQRILLGAADALVSQISNNSACERLHSPLQRLIRWLLLVDDRAVRRDLMLTQGTLAQLQGVRRESISLAAGRLQRAGLITYARGNLVVIDRAGLEARSCECYRAIKARYGAILKQAVDEGQSL